jgi:hypothetical protein
LLPWFFMYYVPVLKSFHLITVLLNPVIPKNGVTFVGKSFLAWWDIGKLLWLLWAQKCILHGISSALISASSGHEASVV